MVKGVGKGVAGVYWKTTGALAGLLGYPLQGVYKSVYSAVHGGTSKRIAASRRSEGEWASMHIDIHVQKLLAAFEAWERERRFKSVS